jgi:hypothetical protein
MSQRVPKSIWLVTLLVAVILGIWPGIVLAQSNYTGFMALIGWAAFPYGIYLLLLGKFHPDALALFQWAMALAYPFAMLGYSACAYWVIRRTGARRKGLSLVVVAAFVSTLAVIPVFQVASNIILHVPFSFNIGLWVPFNPALWPMNGIILIQLLISAVLGWLISVGLLRGHLRRRKEFVGA